MIVQTMFLEGQKSDRRPSCERQERDLRAFAKRAGHKGNGHVVATFRETASGADNARPERAKVMALAQAHQIDA